MKLLSIIRSQEWWSHKLPPLLAIAYATTLMSPIPIYRISLWLVFLLASLIVGAVYVSVINDITDLEEDIASGKPNRILQISPGLRWLVPVVCIFIGLAFGFFIYPDLLSCSLYSLSWVAFSLYSIKPFRLKNKGILGVLADGCGSHVFPSLLMVANVSYITQQPINWIWFASVGAWALCYGLRGILWHQFEDRDNDILVNLNTYASKIDPKKFKSKAVWLISIELFCLAIMLHQLNRISAIIALVLYFLLMFIRHDRYKNQIILVVKTKNQPFQILMADYYQMLFPISLLIQSSIMNDVNLFILIIHILLFPYTLWLAIYDYVIYVIAIFFHRFRVTKE